MSETEELSVKKECWNCQYWVGSSYLKCTVHPIDPDVTECLDYQFKPDAKDPNDRREAIQSTLRWAAENLVQRGYGLGADWVLPRLSAPAYPENGPTLQQWRRGESERHNAQLEEFRSTFFAVVQTWVEAILYTHERQVNEAVLSQVQLQINRICHKLYRYGFFPQEVAVGIGTSMPFYSEHAERELADRIERALGSLWDHIDRGAVLQYMNDRERIPFSELFAHRLPPSPRFLSRHCGW